MEQRITTEVLQNDPREPKREPWTQFHEKTIKERRKNEICDGRGKKTSEILGSPAEEWVQRKGGPEKGGPTEGHPLPKPSLKN